jgi:hypothetical protein
MLKATVICIKDWGGCEVSWLVYFMQVPLNTNVLWGLRRLWGLFDLFILCRSPWKATILCIEDWGGCGVPLKATVLWIEVAVWSLILVYFMQVPLKATVLCIEEAVWSLDLFILCRSPWKPPYSVLRRLWGLYDLFAGPLESHRTLYWGGGVCGL